MSLNSSLGRALSLTFIGNLSWTLAQWGVLILVAHHCSTETTGRFAYSLAIVGSLGLLGQLQLRQLLTSDPQAEQHYHLYKYLRVWGVIGSGAIVMATMGMVDPQALICAAMLAVAKAGEGMSDIAHGLLQIRNQSLLIARSLLGRSAICLMITWFMVNPACGPAGATVGLMTSNVIMGIIDTFLTRDHPDQANSELRRTSIISILLPALPLAGGVFLVSLAGPIPRSFILHFSGGIDAVAIYSTVAYLAVGGTLVCNTVGDAFAPRLARALAAKEIFFLQRLRCKMLIIVGVTALTGLVLALTIGEALIRMLYGSQYAHLRPEIIAIACATGIQMLGSTLGYQLTAMREVAIQPISNILMVTILFFGCWLFIPKYGVVGAATALGMAFIVQVVARLAWLQLRRTNT